MRLAVFGGHTEAGKRFIQRATRDGFSLCRGDATTIATTLTSAHAVVCLPDFTLTLASLTELIDGIEQYDIRRLIIVGTTLLTEHQLHAEIQQRLADSTIDWTIVQTVTEAIEAIDTHSLSDFLVEAKDLAAFLVNQITDARYLQTTVLVKA